MKSAITAALVLLGFAVAAESQPASDRVSEHVVQRGDTLESIAKRYRGSASAWPEIVAMNGWIKNPDRVYPGQRIRIVIPARFAEIQKVSRKVERKPEPEPWTAALRGDHLLERHGIHTFARSSAELQFEDGTSVTVTEDSLMFLQETRSIAANRIRSAIDIIDGQVDLQKPSAKKKRHDIEITVGTSTITPATSDRATRARIRRDPKASRLMSYDGSATVSSAGKKVVVNQGMGTSAPLGQPPAPPEKLLAAPRAELSGTVTPRPSFRWSAVPGAADYSVEVCRDARCAELLERTTGVTGTEWQPDKPLPAAPLFWRATARSSSGLDGYPGTAQPFTVALAVAGSVRLEKIPQPGVRIFLHRDGGDGLATGEDDTLVTSILTDGAGAFTFGAVQAENYWVVVDSRFHASAWAEQVAGPRGALCSNGRGSTMQRTEFGPCFGGRRGDASDDASHLATAEHVAWMPAGTEGADRADFVFSFDVVTTDRDDERHDKPEPERDAGDARRVGQGSLRQFIVNANALGERRVMRFVPAVPARAGVASREWWTILLHTPLPPLEVEMTLDGTAYDLTNGITTRDTNPGLAGEYQTVGDAGLPLRRPPHPELEIDMLGISGFVIRKPATLRGLAIHSSPIHITTEAPLIAEDLIVGLRADGSIAPLRQNGTGVRVTGSSRARLARMIIADMGGTGVEVAPPPSTASIDAENLVVQRCGYRDPAAHGIALHASGSRVSRSLFEGTSNALGSGYAVWSATAGANVVEHCTFRDNREDISSPGPGRAAGG